MLKLIKRLSEPKTAFVLAILYSFFLTILFLLPGKNLPAVEIPYLDKIVHLILFGLLTFMWLWVNNLKNGHHIVKILWILFLLFFYGIVIEGLQEYLIVARNADSWDLFANFLGILIGLLVFRYVQSQWSLKS